MSNNNEEINEETMNEMDVAAEEMLAHRRTQVPLWTDRQWKVESMAGRLIHIRQLPTPEHMVRNMSLWTLKALVDHIRSNGYRHGGYEKDGWDAYTNYTLSPHQHDENCADCGAPSNFMILEGNATLWLHCGICLVG